MNKTFKVQPVTAPIHGTIRPPGSKSLTNRALIIAALAKGTSQLLGVLDSVDTRVMSTALSKLGIDVEANFADNLISTHGCGGRIPADKADLWCENSGTSIRFLTALCSIGNGTYRLDGNERMRERPIAPLIKALSAAGVNASCETGNDCPPVIVKTDGLNTKTIEVAGSISSQYLSGLLMIAPAAQQNIAIQVTGELVSRPYIDMTLAIMRSFGAVIDEPETNQFLVKSNGYTARNYDIEPDASAASYFFAAAAITGGEVTVEGLNRDALQGDVGFVDALVNMGCEAKWNDNSITVIGKQLRGIDIDMNAISDTAQTLACVAPFAEGPTRIRNVAHNRVKETDRITAVVDELKRAGIDAEEHEDGMTISPGPPQPATIKTYDDHRMAMSFALLGLKAPGIIIADPECTSKTYPEYFSDLTGLCRGTL
ncbi:3-phosphoshikimate 1-carboxyvinyltransferase [Planctomicrobium sp.]|jgi:3-phosphoshikimate 1-carboxyvinyltransferase|nr:3-phosphoshikimate 1-carboxyvinyltransferase [Planctomicrobium sp.]MDA7503384.1 3-phosphoshikimate 1-carboxyvinyltransferase [bacterium]MBT5020553.1 3-phosphoshikimate 1-carboxyvinyltransferase [Planctomicrobium sp.]MDB4439350.1 3-phosphoshikimate 1-carboxyvinyltransferase [Planctomicrobium sp.]MDB4733134.1 3-phosphoshikimate 1-carboxyvinyltransferase [Planctomicrobium sp.]MDB4743202.1 3-phosphoshikimate 1-carboxyvinyltransferase [Planctomicrobium sp.]